MATIYIDPSVLTTGTGTFVDPFRSWASVTWTAGNLYLQKEGTTFNDTVTIGATGTAGNTITLGTYDATNGNQIVNNRRRQATIAPTSNIDAVFGTGRSYITVTNLTLICGGGFPNASLRLLNGSFLKIEYCVCTTRPGRIASYGVRFDNQTGSTISCTDWTISNNYIYETGGNAGILCIRSGTSGEGLANVIVENNVIENIPFVSGSAGNGIQIQGRTSTIYLDRAGLCISGVRVKNNTIKNTSAYGMYTQAVIAGTSFYNEISGNYINNVGTGLADVHCIGVQGVQDMLVFDNIIDKSYAFLNGVTGSGVGIFVDTPSLDSRDGCDRVKVFNNKIFNTGINASNNLEVGGAAIFVLGSREIDILGNYMQNCPNGVVVQAGSPAAHSSQNVRVINNTAVNMSRNAFMTIQTSDLITVTNNIALNCDNGFYVQTITSIVTNYTENNNIAFNCTLPYADGSLPDGTVLTARSPSGSNVTTNPQIALNGFPNNASIALTGGANVGWIRDLSGTLGKLFRGAYSTTGVAAERGVR